MRQKENQITIYSKNPLWINDNGDCRCLQNEFSDRECIEVTHLGGSQQEYNISKGTYTIIPEIGLILYKTHEDAVRYQSIIHGDDEANQLRFITAPVLENYQQAIDLDFQVESGLYVIDEMEAIMTKMTRMSLDELRYLDNIVDIKFSNARTIKRAEGQLRDFCYSLLVQSGFDFENNTNLVADYRCIFEVSNIVEGHPKLTTFKIKANPIFGFVRFSDLNGYPIFINKENAVLFRNDVRNGITPWESTILSTINTKEYGDEIDERNKKYRNAAITALQYAITNWQYIYKGFGKVKEFVKNHTKKK